MLDVIGGTYLEVCYEPEYYELYGSGFRAAILLSEAGVDVNYYTFCGPGEIDSLRSICNGCEIKLNYQLIEETIKFVYKHPLAKPLQIPLILEDGVSLSKLTPKKQVNVLFYGMAEGDSQINGEYVVYDPQNWRSFKQTGSTAQHLAIVLNKNEAAFFAQDSNVESLEDMGRSIMTEENAEVIIIKDGSNGALVIEKDEVHVVPVFETKRVWPIGSGDVFSAVFAWQWIEEKLSPVAAANYASKSTAFYCENLSLCKPSSLDGYNPIYPDSGRKKNIYLAGPFFSMSERWLVKELRQVLIGFGNDVFSPFHDVGLGINKELVDKDIEGIKRCDVLLAVARGLDPGTFFEIGYARALGKKVIVFAESVSPDDLAMLTGTGCEVTFDFSTTVYKASW